MADKKKAQRLEEEISAEGIGVSSFISADVKKFLEETYGETFFPFLGIFLFKKGELIFLTHKEIKSIPNEVLTIHYEKKSSKEDIMKLIEFLKTRGAK